MLAPYREALGAVENAGRHARTAGTRDYGTIHIGFNAGFATDYPAVDSQRGARPSMLATASRDVVVLTPHVASPEQEHVSALIDSLRRDRRTRPHHGRRDYSMRAREVAAACNTLIDTEPAVVPALTRHAVERITTALAYLDDSNCSIGADLHTMLAVHARACAAAPPDPTRLARWLAALRLDGPGWPDFELRDFAPALGTTGMAELARIIDQRSAGTDPIWFGIRILREQLADSAATSTTTSPSWPRTSSAPPSTARSSTPCAPPAEPPKPSHGLAGGSTAAAPLSTSVRSAIATRTSSSHEALPQMHSHSARKTSTPIRPTPTTARCAPPLPDSGPGRSYARTRSPTCRPPPPTSRTSPTNSSPCSSTTNLTAPGRSRSTTPTSSPPHAGMN